MSGSKFPVGSSAISIDGLFTNALANATLCCSPPDSSCGYIFALLLNPTNDNIIGTCLLICLGVALTIYIAYATLSYTVLSGNSLKSWNTTPILLLKYGTLLGFKNVVSFPFIIMFPDVGSSSFNISFISVDFPLPDEPTKNANSPLSILKLAFFTAFVPVSYVLLTFLNSIISFLPFGIVILYSRPLYHINKH